MKFVRKEHVKHALSLSLSLKLTLKLTHTFFILSQAHSHTHTHTHTSTHTHTRIHTLLLIRSFFTMFFTTQRNNIFLWFFPSAISPQLFFSLTKINCWREIFALKQILQKNDSILREKKSALSVLFWWLQIHSFRIFH